MEGHSNQFESSNSTSSEKQIKDSSQVKSGGPSNILAILLVTVVIVLGVVAGYFLSQKKANNSIFTTSSNGVPSASTNKGSIVGSNDLTTFKDSVSGVLQKGGINNEGQYHLVRPGGDSQNVYLTSSIVDLAQFIGKKIKVNGQTQAAKTAGWLMDVGRVEVLE
jgi:hypothetical protein